MKPFVSIQAAHWEGLGLAGLDKMKVVSREGRGSYSGLNII